MIRSVLLTISLLALFVPQQSFEQVVRNTTPFFLKQPINWEASPHFFEHVDNRLELEKVLGSAEKDYRFGKEISVSVDMKESSILHVFDSVRISHYTISSPGAHSINLIFSTFKLAPSARLYIFNPKSKTYLGAYTALNNNAANVLGTEILAGDEVVIILEENLKDSPSTLHLGTLIHGFRNADELAKSLGSSGNCHYDVNCPEGAGWQDQIKSVVMLVNGGGFCTGALINQASNTVKPYVITANHCGTNPASWVFRFRWEAPVGQTVCGTGGNSGNGPENMNITGAALKANWSGSDVMLVELNAQPSTAWNIYYTGWDRSGQIPVGAVGLHHPAGDIKKISIESSQLTSSAWSNTPSNSHWQVPSWDKGVTEPGSSGSPLFDMNRRFIGQLHGGNSSCGGNDLSDDYGKLAVSWEGGGSPATRVKDWLDPNNSGAVTIDGYDPLGAPTNQDAALSLIEGANKTYCTDQIQPSIRIMNAGLDTLKTVSINFGYDGQITQSIAWSGALSRYETAVIQLPSIVLPAGTHTLKAIVQMPNGVADQNLTNDTLLSQFNLVVGGSYVKLDLLLDCWGSETSWQVVNNQNTVIYSSPAYADDNAVLIKDSFCLNAGCFTFKLFDKYGDGMSGQGCNGVGGGYMLKDPTGNVLVDFSSTQSFSVNDQSFCLVAGVSTAPQLNYKVFPNPTQSMITIKGDVHAVELKDLQGKLIYRQTVQDGSATLDLSNFANGMYLLSVTSSNGSTTQPIVKQ